MQNNERLWELTLTNMKERLREPLGWYPFPLLLSFSLVLLFTGHIVFGLSPRMGNPSNVIIFPSETVRDSAIWISVTPIGDEIVATTGDRHVFRWDQNTRSLHDLQPVVSYLKMRVEQEIESAALSKKAYINQVRVVIAADQRLKFLHVRPLIYALADARITDYAFETRHFHTGEDGLTDDASHGVH